MKNPTMILRTQSKSPVCFFSIDRVERVFFRQSHTFNPTLNEVLCSHGIFRVDKRSPHLPVLILEGPLQLAETLDAVHLLDSHLEVGLQLHDVLVAKQRAIQVADERVAVGQRVVGHWVVGRVVDGGVQDDDTVLVVVAVCQNVAHADQGDGLVASGAQVQGQAAALQCFDGVSLDAEEERRQVVADPRVAVPFQNLRHSTDQWHHRHESSREIEKAILCKRRIRS